MTDIVPLWLGLPPKQCHRTALAGAAVGEAQPLRRGRNLEELSLSQEAARLLALELYRKDRVSLGRAAELCHTPLAAFMDFAGRHAVRPLRQSFEDLEKERQTADRLKTCPPPSVSILNYDKNGV